MQNSPLLSVIIPVYNSELYLDRCLQSLLNQTYQNLEIILINDGSTDQSLSMCQSFEKNDSRIKVIDQQNGGVSVARNRGMQEACGKLITFVDSDDWIEPDMYEILVPLLIENQADIACCKAKKAFPENSAEGKLYASYKRLETNEINIYENKDCLRSAFEIINKQIVTFSVWNKVFRREILQGQQFPEGIWDEDAILLTRVLSIAKKVVLIDKYLYYWYQHDASITHSKDAILSTKSHITKFDIQLSLLEKHQLTQAYHNVRYSYYRSVLYLYCILTHHKPKDANWKAMKKLVVNRYRDLKKEAKIHLSQEEGVPRRHKYMQTLSFFSIKLYALTNPKCLYW